MSPRLLRAISAELFPATVKGATTAGAAIISFSAGPSKVSGPTANSQRLRSMVRMTPAPADGFLLLQSTNTFRRSHYGLALTQGASPLSFRTSEDFQRRTLRSCKRNFGDREPKAQP